MLSWIGGISIETDNIVMAKMDISETKDKTKDKNLLVSMRSLDLLFLLQSRHRVWISGTAIWETNYC